MKTNKHTIKKLKYFFCATLLFAGVILLAGDNSKKGYETIDRISHMKKYNPNAVWHKVKCHHCNGTGHVVKYKYDAKKNRMFKYLVPCPYCHGKGYRGMSKY